MILLQERMGMGVTRIDRIRLSYTLTFVTPFHFGTGLSNGLLDRTVVRDSGEYLYVPGSTLKGTVRERCEWLARLYESKESDERIRVVDLHDEKKALWGLSQMSTMVTRIFGSQQRPGHLFFNDARQSEEERALFDGGKRDDKSSKGKYKSAQTDIYTQVRLDRPTHTSVSGALFTSEFGIRNFAFQGSIEGWLECTPIKSIPESPTYSLLLLLAGLLMLDAIGGNKSTGKGRCNLAITELRVNDIIVSNEGQYGWRSWFDNLGVLADYASAIREEG
jgi:CRISPR/Cas system CSM-associated protein Csm3 (group 7 of RAMP superfamily)